MHRNLCNLGASGFHRCTNWMESESITAIIINYDDIFIKI